VVIFAEQEIAVAEEQIADVDVPCHAELKKSWNGRKC